MRIFTPLRLLQSLKDLKDFNVDGDNKISRGNMLNACNVDMFISLLPLNLNSQEILGVE